MSIKRNLTFATVGLITSVVALWCSFDVNAEGCRIETVEPNKDGKTPKEPLDDYLERTDRDARRLTISQMSILHRRVQEFCRDYMPAAVKCYHCGPLADEAVQPIIGIERTDPGDCLKWRFSNGGTVYLKLDVSLKKIPSTVASCKIDGDRLYLNIQYIHQGRPTTEVQPKLSRRFSPINIVRLIADSVDAPLDKLDMEEGYPVQE